ncbi:MAG: amidase, partial [Microbacterium sp.]
MAHDIPAPGIAADVASLATYRLALLPDPVTAVGAAIPPRPEGIAPRAPSLAPPSDPVAEIESVLADLEGAGRELGAVDRLLVDEARIAAEESRRRLDAGTARPLEGLAFGVKDVIQVEGSPTAFGSPAYDGFVPETTAQVVRNLRDAGAILVAKLATYEFASGPNSRTGNPWGTGRRSGGSSSGSAAAVGAGLLPLALGTDSGGSIRVPAAWCGVVGMKPTRTRVPTTGVPPLSWHLDHTGTLTCT